MPTCTWTGNNTSAWNDGNSWDLLFMPGPADNAIIPDVGANPQPILDSSRGITDVTLTADATLDLNSFTLTMTGDLVVAASASILNVAGTMKFNGTADVDVNGGDLNDVEITADHSITLLSALQVNDLANNGAVYYSGFLLTIDGNVSGSGYFAAKGYEIKIGGAWKEHTAIFVKVAGAWKNVIRPYVKVGGTWKSIL